MKNDFVEKVQTLNIKFATLTSYADEMLLDDEKAELKCDIAIAAYNGDISITDCKSLFNLFIF